ncbi:transmembrane prolyl 4-hydroxylase-like [Solea senegalensis]|uniref:Transmembrane prolyl 4-hydroxylase-like n=1 Tax=Solea senegalensis TaxID=28829 RepID=A0AAV6ST43_SOLSE|nr:transmembrane prolyl 4-hydroxylase-like [Solea senegalensis]KAG7519793.1 transmembrane prolyl 4-hydroxylase-like [Solea senegalensis]
MEDTEENVMEQEEPLVSGKKPSSSRRSTRLNIQRSSVCSRAYFVVVMVFFHVYILNVIALLLYVHYNNGAGDLVSGDTASSAAVSQGGSSLPRPSAPAARQLHVEEHSQTFSLSRIEGIRVGHVQHVSLVPGRTHAMVTLSLKPLLFEIPGFLSEEECRVVVQLAQLKGLMESQTPSPSPGREDSNQPLLSISTEEVFSLLDLNQDGLLQKQEIVSHSRSRDGTWLSPDNLRQILTGLEVRPTGFLTLEDFRHVYDVSQGPGQQRSGKLQSHFKQRSKHTWLYQGSGSHHILQTLRNRVITLTRLPSSLVELSEPLQVIRYEQGDFSDAHHDSSHSHLETSCAHTRLAGNTSALTEVSCRYLTVLFYLNSAEEGGETTFPVADNRTYDEQALVQDGADLTNTQETCGRGNLRIKPSPGTALLWYNHLSDGRGWIGELDEYSLHGDCPVRRGVKWAANSWVNVDPDHQMQARYQRLVAQRHQAKSVMEEHYQPLSHSDLHQDL